MTYDEPSYTRPSKPLLAKKVKMDADLIYAATFNAPLIFIDYNSSVIRILYAEEVKLRNNTSVKTYGG